MKALGMSSMSHVRHSITVYRPRQMLYDFWRDLENLPQFMQHLHRVEDVGDGRSHWVAKAPGGLKLEWDAEIVDDVPGTRIAWRSLPSADVKNSGSVMFLETPHEDATEVIVDIHYQPPGGLIGSTLARLFGEDPTQQLWGDLRRFKQIAESRADATKDISEPLAY